MIPVRLGILISGTGSNMAAIITASSKDNYPAKPTLVLSNRPEAKGLAIAMKAGVKTTSVDHRQFGGNREAFEREVDKLLSKSDIELVALAGFMRIFSPWMISRWRGRMVNIHPSLLPKYKGLNTHARALEAKEKEHGCTVHWVSNGVDEGQIIDQSRVRIEPDDTEESLSARVLEAEHSLYPRAIAAVCATIKRL